MQAFYPHFGLIGRSLRGHVAPKPCFLCFACRILIFGNEYAEFFFLLSFHSLNSLTSLCCRPAKASGGSSPQDYRGEMSGVETKHTTFTFTKGEPALVCFRGEAERTSRLQANAETLLQDHSTAAGGGITAEVTQKSRGNFVLTSQGAFQRFSSRRSTTKKRRRAPQKS